MKELEDKFENKIEFLSKLISHQAALAGNSPVARTCHELMTSNPTLESGMYYIDPDGWNAGDPSISVYCDKTTGKSVNFQVKVRH